MNDKNIDRLTTPLDEIKKGDTLSARVLKQPAQWINRNFSGAAPPRQVIPETNKQPRQFRVVEVLKDHITAKPWNGVEEIDAIFKIALPSLLRRTPFDFGLDDSITDPRGDGIKYTYTTNIERLADSGAKTETQVIQPSYLEDDIIYAQLSIIGGTAVTTSENNEEPETIFFLDINVDGRAWAKKDDT